MAEHERRSIGIDEPEEALAHTLISLRPVLLRQAHAEAAPLDATFAHTLRARLLRTPTTEKAGKERGNG